MVFHVNGCFLNGGIACAFVRIVVTLWYELGQYIGICIETP